MKTREKIPERTYGGYLHAEPVDNEVTWRNSHFPKELPPDVHGSIIGEVGTRSKLGLFLTPNKTAYKLFVIKEHAEKRSRVTEARQHYFKDDEGNLYQDLDLKGTGHAITIEGGLEVGSISSYNDPPNLKDLEKDRDWAELLHKEGLRVVRHIAHIKLKEIIYEGRKITIEQAKKISNIKANAEPAIAVRAFGVRTRTYQLLKTPDAEKEEMLEDARKHVAKELGINPQRFTKRNYLNWFAKTIGKNLGKLHALGYRHDNLYPNVTLDARLVDFATIDRRSGGFDSEAGLAIRIITDLANDYLKTQEMKDKQLHEDLKQKFQAAYDKANPPKHYW